MTLRQTICLLIAFFAGASFITACMPQPTTQAETLDQYLITIEDLPLGWKLSIPPRRFMENYGQANDLDVEFKNGNRVEQHLVLAYSDAKEALNNYKYLVPAFLNVTTATVKPPYVPKDINFSSSIAQEFTLKCEVLEFTNSEVCTYIALYGDKVIVFNTHVMPGIMSASDLEKVLHRIDEKMRN